MPFHLIERLIGVNPDPKHFLRDKKVGHLMQEGFTQSEAEQISWLIQSSQKGFYLGLLTGLGALYFVNPFYAKFSQTIPQLKYQPNFGRLIKVSFVGCFALFGDYLSNSKRQSANFWLINYFSNNSFTWSKEAFVRNFSVLNRPFTEKEIEQFLANSVREREGDRRWIYNPNIHTNVTEEEFKQNMDLYFKKKIHPTDRSDVKKSIIIENKDKIDNGEEIQLKAYKITNDVDKDGFIHGVAHAPINKYGVFQSIL